MNNNTETLKTFALETNGLLLNYIELHDKILKECGTFQSLFTKIDFEKIFYACCDLLHEFESTQEKIVCFKAENEQCLNENEKTYFNQLLIFFDKLLITVKLLCKKQDLLYQKSKKEKITWKEYNSTERQYKKSIENYLTEAKKLNCLNTMIF